MKRWWQSKTVWTGVAGVVTAVSGYATGEMTLGTAVQTALTGLAAIFLRTGVGVPIGRD